MADPSPKRNAKPYKLNKRTRLTAERPLTALRLEEILRRAVGGAYVTPGAAEVDKLCSILNFWHAHFYQAQEDRAFNELIDAAQAAIESLTVVMPKIRDELATQDKKAGGQDPFTTWALRDAQKATEILCRPIPEWKSLQRRALPDQAKDWRWLADVLPTDIEKALMPSNTKYRGGRSKTGPLARILAQLIPIVTGETVTAVAVGTQLSKIATADAA